MTAIRFTPHAKRQLLEIWDHSAQRWGEKRANRYLQAINDAIVAAMAGKRRIQSCEEYGAGLQFVRSRSQNIYFRTDRHADTCDVVGVLHQRMEPSRHLPERDDE